MFNAAWLIVAVNCFVLILLTLAAIFSPTFRKDFLGAKSDGSVLEVLTATGAALVVLDAILVGGAVLAARIDYDNELKRIQIELANTQTEVSVLRSKNEESDLQIYRLTNEARKLPSNPTAPLTLKVSNQDPRPFCDSAGSPLPARVPLKNSMGLTNLALLLQASAFASSKIEDALGARHSNYYLNDGWYNNCRSWIPNVMPAYAGIDLGYEYEIYEVVLGSEHEPYYRDRAATKFSIQVSGDGSCQISGDGSSWRTVYVYPSGGDPIRGTTRFPLTPPVHARCVKIEILGSVGGPVRIDELEVYGKPI